MKAKYDSIGIGYNLTRKADSHLTQRILHYLQPQANHIYLDIGCGSGNYTHEIHKKNIQCIGIDPSITMLEKARKRNSNIAWRVGTAEKTMLLNQSIQGVLAFLTIHHWSDMTKGILELSRVLKDQGRIIIFTASHKQMKGYWLSHYFPKMIQDSIQQMPSLKTIIKAFKNANIKIITKEPYFIKPDLQDQFLYCGKHNPELYFDQQIRNGISSFSSLANTEEVTKGLANLRKDIDSGTIQEVIKSYKNDLGDYIFIVGQK